MTPEAMNRKLAEWMGWTYKEVFESSFADSSKKVSRGFKWHHPNGHITNPPRYTESLDAVAEVEARLTPEQRHQFGVTLHVMGAKTDKHPCYYAISATATQRCIALCRTFGERIAAALQSKQDEIDKLRIRAEQAEATLEQVNTILRETQGMALKAEHARDEAMEALKKVVTVWERQSGRVFESMGMDNPRAEAIDDEVRRAAEIIARHAIRKPGA